MNVFSFIKDNFVDIAATVAIGIATGGSSLAVQVIGYGSAILIGSSIDTDRKKRENEGKQLDLKKDISNETKKEVENLQNQRNQDASEVNTMDQQLAQKQTRLNDPNTPEEEKIQLRSDIATIMANKSSKEQNMKNLDEKISNLIKSNSITKPGSIINLPKAEELDFQTKLIIGGIIFLIIYFMVIKDSDRR